MTQEDRSRQDPGRPRGLLRADHDFRWFWGGHSLSVTGTQVTAVALPLVAALSLDAGAAGVSIVATASFLPNLLLPLLVGHWLEQRRKRRIMIWADAFRAVLLATVPLAYLTDYLSMPLLAVVAFGVGAASVVFEIGAFAYLPSLVPEDDLGQANRAIQGSTTVAQVGGPGLAGLLVQLMGPALTIVVDAVSYVASMFGVGAARRPEPPPEPPDQRPHILSGIRILVVNPYLRALTIYASVYNAAGQIFFVNLIIWTIKERDVSAGLYGLALSGWGLGAFLGTMAALWLAARLGFGRAAAAAAVLSCGVLLVIAALPVRGISLGLAIGGVLVVSGIGLGTANVLSATLRQTVIPRNQLARTTGSYRLLMYGSIPLGSALGGVLGETVGSRFGVAIGTIGIALSALPMLGRTVRSLRDPKDARANNPESTTTTEPAATPQA